MKENAQSCQPTSAVILPLVDHPVTWDLICIPICVDRQGKGGEVRKNSSVNFLVCTKLQDFLFVTSTF